jgi:methionine sulfoxide reductase catalytic subunit
MGTDAGPIPGDLPAPASSSVSPDTVRDWRWQLTPGEDQISPATRAGSVPQATGIAPR